MDKHKKLELQYAPMIETLEKEISITKVYLADLVDKKSKLIKEYIAKGVSNSR